MNPGIFGISNGITSEPFSRVIRKTTPQDFGIFSVYLLAAFANASQIAPDPAISIPVGVLSKVVDINAKGVINWLAIWPHSAGASGENFTVSVVIDGNIVMTGSGNTSTDSFYGAVLIGGGRYDEATGKPDFIAFQPTPFTRNFQIWISRAILNQSPFVYANIDYYR